METFPARQGMPLCGNYPLGAGFRCQSFQPFFILVFEMPLIGWALLSSISGFSIDSRTRKLVIIFSVLCYLRIIEWLGLIITNILADLVFETNQQHFIKYIICLEIQKEFRAVNALWFFFFLFATAFPRKRRHFCLNLF